ncbi:hypothetical protein [Paracoccus sp. (in: a-proteobacteria)]|uniref:alpha/beta fold hydrolase n=1 Tax=Paracoccus sp. TaxID=267 RepID=UPI0028A05C1E|nr:hypothetical protein [Paracoccus sp. (in: a-proteobacteria)]
MFAKIFRKIASKMATIEPARDLAEGLDSGKPFLLPLEGKVVPLWLNVRGTSKTLVIHFHGSVDREKRVPPIFSPTLPVKGAQPSQLSISDPAMLEPGNFRLGWYTGQPGFPMQQLLLDVIQKAADHLGADRLIFVGGSGGGFASLYYSWHFPGSVALVAVPQTRLTTYYGGQLRRFREELWPGVANTRALSREICLDVCELYAKEVPNTVIYLQSAGDRFHLETQMAPFVSAVTSIKDSRFILKCDFWGRTGHSNSVDPQEIVTWLEAIISSPTLEVDDLLLSRYQLGATPMRQIEAPAPSTAAPPAERPRADKGFAPQDLELAQILRASLLPKRK